MNWYLSVLKRYVAFDGRARRQEYWMFTLISVIISLVLMAIDHAMGTVSASAGIGTLGAIYALAVLLPSLGVTVRRLHDTDRSGWWLLICLVPLIGGIVLLVFLCIEGTRGSNRFGPDPKALA
jgi:uncharacterized membrane protein YhaH (DUF805 family)